MITMMLKRLMFIFVFLVSLSAVYGQGISVGGQEISIIILIPLIAIIIVVLIFLIMFISDTSKIQPVRSRLNLEDKTKEFNLEIKEEIKPKIWLNYLDVIDTFTRRLEQKDTKIAFDGFIKIFREFFKDRFNLDYEFTYDELLNELKKKGFINTGLIVDLKEVSYQDGNLTKEKIYDLAVKLRSLVEKVDRDKLITVNEDKVNKNFKIFNTTNKALTNIKKEEEKIDNKLNKFLVDETKKLFKSKHNISEIKSNYNEFDKDKLEQISFLIRNGRESLKKNDSVKLKEIYGDLCYLFPFLSDNNKKIAYLEILEFYEDINKQLFPDLYKEIKK